MLNIGQRCTFILVHAAWVCVSLCTYIADVHLFPIFKEKDRKEWTRSSGRRLLSSENFKQGPVFMYSDASVAVLGCAKESVYFPVLPL